MLRRHRRLRRSVDEELLNTVFVKEDEWRNLRTIVDHSIDPLDESRYKLKLSEAMYMFLLKEAKHRRISALRME